MAAFDESMKKDIIKKEIYKLLRLKTQGSLRRDLTKY